MELTERICAETEQFIVFDKPAGRSVHKDEDETGLITQLSIARGEPLWLVHRLDKLTSGILLLARSQEAAAELSEAFRQRQVDKLYLALSRSKPKRKMGRIAGDMEKARGGSWRLSRSQHNPAITDFVSRSAGEGIRLLLCHPVTGKTHQIRVALKSEGAPVLGDSRYEAGSEYSDRGYLHAWQLGFRFNGHTYSFRIDPKQGELWSTPVIQDQIRGLSTRESWPAHWLLPCLNGDLKEIDDE